MTPVRFEPPPPPTRREDGCPRLTGRFGSLDAFWRLIEPILARLQPRRICEVGVEKGIFTARLLAWGQANRCAYVGIDPAAEAGAVALIQEPSAERDGTAAGQLLSGRSLDVLPELEPCGAYFLDGDHNYFTLRNELETIQRTSLPLAGMRAGPIIFLHDVSWPFGRRDMYHDPAGIPADGRHEYSRHLGVSLEGDELIDGGLRSPGQYAIATHAGGPRNGVLTAAEDFLASDVGRGWQVIVVPAAYGLAILYRPDDDSLPAGCRDHLNELRAALRLTGDFLESAEANFLRLYLYSEHTSYELGQQTRALQTERGAHFDTLEAYKVLESVVAQERAAHQRTLVAYRELEQGAHRHALEAYETLDGAYKDLSAHNEASAREYERLQGAYADLSKEYHDLLGHYHSLQRYAEGLATAHHPPTNAPEDAPSEPEMTSAGSVRRE